MTRLHNPGKSMDVGYYLSDPTPPPPQSLTLHGGPYNSFLGSGTAFGPLSTVQVLRRPLPVHAVPTTSPEGLQKAHRYAATLVTLSTA